MLKVCQQCSSVWPASLKTNEGKTSFKNPSKPQCHSTKTEHPHSELFIALCNRKTQNNTNHPSSQAHRHFLGLYVSKTFTMSGK